MPANATIPTDCHVSRYAVLMVAVIASLAVVVAGCAPQKQPDKPKPAAAMRGGSPITNTDPCAMRMHDMSGAFLLFYAVYQRLPDTLQQLRDAPGAEGLPLSVCPTSGIDYVYAPNGIFMADRNARIILYDASPAHSGMRWAVSILEPMPGQPLQTRVMAISEDFFLLRPPPKAR